MAHKYAEAIAVRERRIRQVWEHALHKINDLNAEIADIAAARDEEIALIQTQINNLLEDKDPPSLWRVFDEADCFDSFERVEDAVSLAKRLIADGCSGVEIKYMGEEAFQKYLKNG